MLIQLVQWQIQSQMELIKSFELHLDLKDDGEIMIKSNSPDFLRQRVEKAKYKFVNGGMKKSEKNTVEKNLKYWEQHFELYERNYAKHKSPL